MLMSSSCMLQTSVVKEGLRITVAICARLPLVSSEPLRYENWIIPAGVSQMTPNSIMIEPPPF